jgi:hypothetical protein
MKRITMILIATLTLALLIYAQSLPPVPTTTSKQAAQPTSGSVLTSALRNEYVQLRKSNAGEPAVRAWVKKHKLEIVSLKGYDIMVIPEQATQTPTVQEANSCDPKKCPAASGSYGVFNTRNQYLGEQFFTCKANTCKWVKDSQGRWNRICGGWKCNNGEIFPA